MCRGSLKTFLYPPKIVSVSGGGLKTETGKFLLHFQNSKSSNRCRSVYGTDITINHFSLQHQNTFGKKVAAYLLMCHVIKFIFLYVWFVSVVYEIMWNTCVTLIYFFILCIYVQVEICYNVAHLILM